MSIPLPEPIAWLRDGDEGSIALMTDCCTDRVKQLWLKANPRQVERYKHALFTSDQMHSYTATCVAEAVAAERERCLSEGLGAWVPIAERLPRNNDTVLVWRVGVFSRLAPGRAQITKFRLTGDGPQWDADQDYCMVPPSLARRVTHWMPLPAGPAAIGEAKP